MQRFTGSRVLSLGAALGLTASLALAAPAQAHPRMHRMPYRLGVVLSPDGVRVGGQAVDISDNGRVAVNPVGFAPFIGDGTRATWLAADIPTTAMVKAVAPNGATAGAWSDGPPSPDNDLRWDPDGRPTTLVNPLGLPVASAGSGHTATNSAGTTVVGYGDFPHPGCAGVVSYDSAGRGTPLPTPAGVCDVTGLSEDGTAVGSLLPGYQVFGPFPRGVVYTTAGVRDVLPAEPNGVSQIDGISADGSKLIGRVGPPPAPPSPGTCCLIGTATQPAWVSLTAGAQPLSGAAGLVPMDVNNAGAVVGSKDGRAMIWRAGVMTDLTTQVRLPRGWSLTEAVGINEQGDIAATASNPSTFENMAVKLVRS